MDHNGSGSIPTGPPVQPQQPPPVQQRAQMQAPPPQMMVAQYPPPQGQIRRSDLVPYSKPWHIAKIVLGTSSMICSIILLSIGIYFLTTSLGTYCNGVQYSFVGTAAAMALIWQTAEFITICASSRHRGIHPGANVALHLLIWLVTAIGLALVSVYVSFDSDLYSYRECYYDSYDYEDSSLSDLLSWARQFVALEQVILAFTTLLFVIHFTLFVRACVETHQRNSVPRAIYVPMPMAMAPPGQAPYSYYPAGPPQQQFQPQPQYPYGMQPIPQQQQQQQAPIQREQPRDPHLYGYYAPNNDAVEAPSTIGHDTNRVSTVSSASPPPGHHVPPSVSPGGTNSDH